MHMQKARNKFAFEAISLQSASIDSLFTPISSSTFFNYIGITCIVACLFRKPVRYCLSIPLHWTRLCCFRFQYMVPMLPPIFITFILDLCFYCCLKYPAALRFPPVQQPCQHVANLPNISSPIVPPSCHYTFKISV